MRIISRQEIEQLIGPVDVLPLMRRVFQEFAAGRVELPDRSSLNGKAENDAVLVMPASVPAVGGLGAKVISIFPSNVGRDIPTIASQIILLDAASGAVRAMMDGSYITELRTAGVSALGTDILARKDAAVLGIFGAGAQARAHVMAIHEVRQLGEVILCSRSQERAEHLAEEIRAALGPSMRVHVTTDRRSLVERSHIIATTTTSIDPVFDGSHLQPGTHVSAIGSFKPYVRELDDTTITRSSVFVDIKEHALLEAGDLIDPMRRGIIGEDAIIAELGELVTGAHKGRRDRDEVTVFKSVGAAMEDIIVAAEVCDRADSEKGQ